MSSVGPKSCLTIGGSGFWTATRAVAPWKWRRGGRGRLGGAGVAGHRCVGRPARDRAGIHPWDRVPYAEGTKACAGACVKCAGKPAASRLQLRTNEERSVQNGGRRVVITGVGAVTPIGTGADGLWAGLAARSSAVREITRFDPAPFRSRIAAEIPDFRPQDHLDAKRAKRLDRFSQLAVTSARFALSDAALDPAHEDRDRIGAMMGSALGGVAFAESQVERFRTEGPRGLDPALALAVFPGAASCNIAIDFGFTGPNSTNAMSCASGTIAVGEAFHTIREGRADVMLAGGAEAPLAPMTYAAFSVIRAMSTRNDDPAHASRPFDEDRDGFVMGEGAAVLVLEERARAVARGTKGYYGHALGASGAIEAAICALAMERRWLPPTINLERPDPACDLDCLRGEGRAAAPDVVLTNSFGFGGINAAVVLRRSD